jgi:tetratricopeptide (TPR) repeat protein
MAIVQAGTKCKIFLWRIFVDYDDYVKQGIELMQKNEHARALENFRAAQNLKPGDSDIQDVIRLVEGLINVQAQTSQSLENEARQRAESMGITDVDQAIAEYTEALKRNPNDASAKASLSMACYIRGVTFDSKKEYARAIEDYSDAIKYAPAPEIYNKRGQAYLENGNFTEAIADLEELLRLDPNYNMAKDTLASAIVHAAKRIMKKKITATQFLIMRSLCNTSVMIAQLVNFLKWLKRRWPKKRGNARMFAKRPLAGARRTQGVALDT